MEDKRTASLEARVRDVTASKEAVQSELQLMRKQLIGALDSKTAIDKVHCREPVLSVKLQGKGDC